MRRWLVVLATVVAFAMMGACGDDGDADLGFDEAAPTMNDHWHTAYGIWACDQWLPPLTDLGMDPDGIHSHADGVVHIHPFHFAATGAGANLGRFLVTEGVAITDEQVTLPDGRVLDETSCGSGTRLVVARWTDGALEADLEIIESDLASVRLRDRDALTIAVLAAGESPAKPPSVSTLDVLGDVVVPTSTR